MYCGRLTGTYHSAYSIYIVADVVVLSWTLVSWHRKEETVEQSRYFVFLALIKCSRSFIALGLIHWCHMDYFNDVLTMFLDLEQGSSLTVYAGSESSPI